MPIYEYRCRKCGEFFEKLQRLDEGPESVACPYCGEWEPEKVPAGFAQIRRAVSGSSSCGPSGSGRFS